MDQRFRLLMLAFMLVPQVAAGQALVSVLTADGQPALKYKDNKGCESSITFSKVGGEEEALAVRVSHFHGGKWGEKGWLGITRNRIFFAPDTNQAAEHAFNIPRHEFKEAKVSKDGKVFYLTLLSRSKKNQEFAMACFGPVQDIDDMFVPILDFAVLAANNFDLGAKEFSRLTANIQPRKSEQITLADLLGFEPNASSVPSKSDTPETVIGDFNTLVSLGKTHLKLSLYDEAVKAFKQALQIKADSPEAHNGLGDAYLYSGRPQEAISAYREAIKLNPNYAEAYNGLGVAHGNTYQPEESLKALEQAIRLRPDSPANFYFAGLTYKKLGRRKEAIDALREAIRLRPKFEDAYNALGDIYFDTKDYKAAIEVYTSLIQMKPDSSETHLRLANSLFYLGKNEEAVREYELTIKLSPNDPTGYHNLGNTYAKMGRFEEAITNYQKAIAIKPNYVPSHYMLGRAFLQKGDKASAIEKYNTLKSLDPNTAKLLLNEISK